MWIDRQAIILYQQLTSLASYLPYFGRFILSSMLSIQTLGNWFSSAHLQIAASEINSCKIERKRNKKNTSFFFNFFIQFSPLNVYIDWFQFFFGVCLRFARDIHTLVIFFHIFFFLCFSFCMKSLVRNIIFYVICFP